jgi:twitching motility protein PilT
MEINDILKKIVQNRAVSDLHLTVNSKPMIRDTGNLMIFHQYPQELKPEDTERIARFLMNDQQWNKFQEKGEMDLSYSLPGYSRFRVNAYYQRGSIALALRVIPSEIPTINQLGLPKILAELALKRNGLILCTGPTGSGKSTTLAAMINEINENVNCHIITLEDPIEYMHKHKNSIVNQREINIDTHTFASGLRAALREDPDVILVGEMRDLETISIALEAAETGHLVFATLHTTDAPKTVDRIIDVFPADQQQQVRIQLAATLRGIIAQQLLPKANSDGRVAALEILIGVPAVRNIIREGKSVQLESVIQTGAKYGMIVMDNYLLSLYEKGLIEIEVVLNRASNPDYIRKRLGRNT